MHYNQSRSFQVATFPQWHVKQSPLIGVQPMQHTKQYLYILLILSSFRNRNTLTLRDKKPNKIVSTFGTQFFFNKEHKRQGWGECYILYFCTLAHYRCLRPDSVLPSVFIASKNSFNAFC